MDTLRSGETISSEGGMVRSAEDVQSDKEGEKKGKRQSRKKSKTRSRKKQQQEQHSTSVLAEGEADVPVEVVEDGDMKDTSTSRLSRHHSAPTREHKTRSLSGSRKRLSGWFKRKSRSDSRGRSKSETELSKVDVKVKTKRHESAEDVKRHSRNNDNSNRDSSNRDSSNRDSSYEVYDITKQPRDRLKRMTVRDAVKERRMRKATSGNTLTRLDRYIETEEVGERGSERVRTSSLPDISVQGDDQADRTNDYPEDESGRDGIDNASTLVRGSVTLPREMKSRFSKKEKASPRKAGRVSIEADSDDNIISSPSLPPETSPRLHDKDTSKPAATRSRQASPLTQIEVMVHDVAQPGDKDRTRGEVSEDLIAPDCQDGLSREAAAAKDPVTQPTHDISTDPVKQQTPIVDKDSIKQQTPVTGKDSVKKPTSVNGKDSVKQPTVIPAIDPVKTSSSNKNNASSDKSNDKNVPETHKSRGLVKKKITKAQALKSPHSKAIRRWQVAILDVQKQRRKESLSRFLQLSRSPNPHSLVGGGVSRDLSPGGRRLSSSRSPSPRPRSDKTTLDMVVQQAMAKNKNVKLPKEPVQDGKVNSNTDGSVKTDGREVTEIKEPKSIDKSNTKKKEGEGLKSVANKIAGGVKTVKGNVSKDNSGKIGNVKFDKDKPKGKADTNVISSVKPEITMSEDKVTAKSGKIVDATEDNSGKCEIVKGNKKSSEKSDIKKDNKVSSDKPLTESKHVDSDRKDTKKETESDKRNVANDTKDIKNSLGVPHHIDRSLSDGEGRSVLQHGDKSSQKCKRSHSSGSGEQIKGVGNGERNSVPVMGTSVQQKYKRTFSPKREDVSQNNEPTSCNKEPIGCENCENSQQDGANDKSPSRIEHKRDEIKKVVEKSENSKGVLDRGRDSQKKRKTGRSFRRKKEVEEDIICAEEVQKQEAEVVREDDLSPSRLLYDKSTQTSEIDLVELSKLITKSKKTKKSKKEKEKEKDKKKLKEITSLIRDSNKEEDKKLRKSAEPETKPLDKDVQEKEDISKVPEPEVTSDTEDKTVDEKSGEDDAKPKPKKLSLATMVFLKARVASRRKKKVSEDKTKKNKDDADSGKDMFLIENEINLSKLADIKETDILDDEIIEPGELGIDFPKKQIRFEPVASDEPIQGEEPLPPLSRNRVKRMSRRESNMRDKRRKCLQCCKQFTAFLFSHIGLCSLVVAYTIMGGFIFKAIEGPYEEKVKSMIRDTRVKVVDKLLQHATELSLSEIGHENFTHIVNLQLKEFQKTVFKETKENGWDGKDNTDSEIPEMQWSFASSLLYAITVMTTIGYGHVAPKTDQGRIVTIGYAVLGIPLTLLCLTNIGDVMATGFRLLYGKVCCGLCCKLFRPRRRRIPDLEKGLAHHVMASDEEETDKPKEVIQVPTSLCILLIAGYIFAGALLFATWEKWDYLTGSYFCFITLSTIGFGDIVPGTDINAWSQEEKLVVSAMYLVFGLSLIAMCFNLVQEDVKAKCRWLGMKIGIIEKPESSV